MKIPSGVYYSAEHDNFYDLNFHGLGNAFHARWLPHWHRFPQSRSELKPWRISEDPDEYAYLRNAVAALEGNPQ